MLACIKSTVNRFSDTDQGFIYYIILLANKGNQVRLHGFIFMFQQSRQIPGICLLALNLLVLPPEI